MPGRPGSYSHETKDRKPKPSHGPAPRAVEFLFSFSDEEPGPQGPRRVSKEELHDVFDGGWVIESIEPSRSEVRPGRRDLSFSEGGPKAWLAVVRPAG